MVGPAAVRIKREVMKRADAAVAGSAGGTYGRRGRLAGSQAPAKSDDRQATGDCPATVTTRCWRFAARSLEGRPNASRSGTSHEINDGKTAAVVTSTLGAMPSAATHWSIRSTAKARRLSTSTAHHIWPMGSLHPYRSETFKLWPDPLFVEKVRTIIDLYPNPLDRALALRVDDKPQIRRLDRTQPLLRIRPGRAKCRSRDYPRRGTSSLVPPLDVKARTLISKPVPRRRAEESRRFLNTAKRNVSANLDIHIDETSSQKTQLIRNRSTKRPSWHSYFTATSSSSIDPIEHFIELLTEHQIKSCAPRSTNEPGAAAIAYIDTRNANSKLYCFVPTAGGIPASNGRCRQRTLVVQAQCA